MYNFCEKRLHFVSQAWNYLQMLCFLFFTGQRVHFQVLSRNQVSLQTSLEVLSGASCVFQVGSIISFQLFTSD